MAVKQKNVRLTERCVREIISSAPMALVVIDSDGMIVECNAFTEEMFAYDEGELGILELLDAYRTGLRSRIRWLDLKHRAKEAQIQLELASGKGVTP